LLALVFLLNRKNIGLKSCATLAIVFLCGYGVLKGSYEIRNSVYVDQGGATVERTWENFLIGTYPDFVHVNPDYYGYPYRDDPLYQKMYKDRTFAFAELKRRFFDNPGDYIKWYFGGKAYAIWQWDMAPGGTKDVFVYPMKKSAFDEDGKLRWIRDAMFVLHPIILFFGLIGLLLTSYRLLKSNTRLEYLAWLPMVLIILYHEALLSVLFPVPRLSIPLRPYLYIFAAFGVASAVPFLSITKQRIVDTWKIGLPR